jgi:hypothetical protein
VERSGKTIMTIKKMWRGVENNHGNPKTYGEEWENNNDNQKMWREVGKQSCQIKKCGEEWKNN